MLLPPFIYEAAKAPNQNFLLPINSHRIPQLVRNNSAISSFVNTTNRYDELVAMPYGSEVWSKLVMSDPVSYNIDELFGEGDSSWDNTRSSILYESLPPSMTAEIETGHRPGFSVSDSDENIRVLRGGCGWFLPEVFYNSLIFKDTVSLLTRPEKGELIRNSVFNTDNIHNGIFDSSERILQGFARTHAGNNGTQFLPSILVPVNRHFRPEALQNGNTYKPGTLFLCRVFVPAFIHEAIAAWKSGNWNIDSSSMRILTLPPSTGRNPRILFEATDSLVLCATSHSFVQGDYPKMFIVEPSIIGYKKCTGEAKYIAFDTSTKSTTSRYTGTSSLNSSPFTQLIRLRGSLKRDTVTRMFKDALTRAFPG